MNKADDRIKAQINSIKQTTCKYNGKPALRLDLITDRGIKSKTINLFSSDHTYLIGKLGTSDFQKWKDQQIDIQLTPSVKKVDFLDVTILKD